MSGDDVGGGDGGGSLVIEDDEFVQGDYGTHTIEGTLLNDTGEEQSYVEVESTVYNANDVRVDSFLDNTNNLADGERWRFEILVTADLAEIDSYEIVASAGL